MILTLLLPALVAGFSFLNRLRGTGKEAPLLPGKVGLVINGRVPATIGVGLLALLAVAPLYALGWALTFLLWSAFAWGRWFALGRLPRGWNRVGQEPKSYERIIESIADRVPFLRNERGENDHAAFLLRSAFASPGLLLLAGPLAAIAFPFAVVAIYELGWRLHERKRETFDDPIEVSEWVTGALWGVLLFTAI
jgi:hypothetical protein